MRDPRTSPSPLLKLASLAGCVGIAALAAQLETRFALAAGPADAGPSPAPKAAAAAPSPKASDAASPTAAAPQMSAAEWRKDSGGSNPPERYQIVKGDTLSGISRRFFGDGSAWPKLYEWNKSTISNPNLIYPNRWIVFVPGTGTSLPKLSVQPDAAAAPAPEGGQPAGSDQISSGSAKQRSQEWKLLPRQPWETTPATLPSNVDALGFDKDNKLHFSKAKGFDLAAIAATERINFFGQIVGARSGGEYLTLGDTVYIRADEDIQVGETYAITQEPATLSSHKSDRTGYSYLILGKVKIIGVRDDLFIGTITSGHDFIYRGNEIIANPARVPALEPIPAPVATEAVMMMDKHFSTFYTAQHKLIFVDRGSADGVKQGMVFRAYEHYDLSNEKKITSSDFIIDADMMVVQVSDRFSTAVIINSILPVTENSTAVLLTDVSDLLSHKGFRGALSDEKKKSDELDELDKLDGSGGLGKEEQKELEQLEKWKGNQPGQPTPTPTEEVPPPPPAAGAPVGGTNPLPEPTPMETTAPPPAAPGTPPAPAPENPAASAPTDSAAPPPASPSNDSVAPPAASPNSPPPPSAPVTRKKTVVNPAPEPAAPAPPSSGAGSEPSQESKDLDRLLNQ